MPASWEEVSLLAWELSINSGFLEGNMMNMELVLLRRGASKEAMLMVNDCWGNTYGQLLLLWLMIFGILFYSSLLVSCS